MPTPAETSRQPTAAPQISTVATSGETGAVVPVSHAEPSIKALESTQRTLFVTVGADITWNNDDGVTHTVTSNQGWFNQQVEPGDSFSWQPTRAGIYRYHCEIHDNIQGTIIVSLGGAVAPVYYQGSSIPKYFADSCGGCHGAKREGGTGPALILGRILHDGFLSPDNKHFYLASQTDNWMTVIDVDTWQIVDKISTGDTPHPGSGAAWEADGTIYGATVHAGEGKVTVWDLNTNEIVGTVPTAGPGLFLRSSDHSPYVWADALFWNPPNTTTVFKKEQPFEVVEVIEEGVMTLHPEFTDDGEFVYISDWKGDAVRVYDAESLEKIVEIRNITTPTGIFNTARRTDTLGH